MKAAVVTGPGKTPVFADFDTPIPRPGEQLLTMRASALSNLAKSRAMGAHYSSSDAYPAIAGVDGVGTTAEGKRFYFALPEPPFGALAELCPVPVDRCVPVPDSLDDVTAAAIANPGMSCWAALVERAHLNKGETVLINGATGTAGRIAVQLARHLGAARILATGRNPQELAKLGADVTLTLPGGDPDSAKQFERSLIESFSSGIGVVVDYLWGSSALAILIAIAKGVESASPVRFVNVGSAGQQQDVALPSAALRSSSVVLMGSGLKSVPLPVLLRSVERIFEAVGAAGLQIATRVAPLSAVEQAWAEDTGRPRLVFTM